MGWIGSMAAGFMVPAAARAAGGLAVHAANLATAAFTRTFTFIASIPMRIGGMVLHMLGTIGSFIISLPGRILGGLHELASRGFGVVKSVISGVFNLLKIGVGTLLVVVGAVATGALKAAQAAASFGRSIADLRGATGLGTGAASGLLGRLSSLGIGRDEAAGMFDDQNPLLFNMRQRMYGLPGLNDPRMLPAMAARYQRMNDGGMGTMMARQQLAAQGMDNPAMRRILMMPPGMIREQQNYQANTQARLGISPGMLVSIGRQFDMLTTKIKIFADLAVAKIGQQVLPHLNSMLEMATNYLGANAGRIGAAIIKGVDMAWRALLRFGNFMFNTFPKLVQTATLSVLDWIEVILKAMPNVWQGFLVGLSIVENFIDDLAGGAARTYAFVAPLAQSIWKSLIDGLKQIYLITINMAPVLGMVVAAVGKMLHLVGHAVRQFIQDLAKNPIIKGVLKAAGVIWEDRNQAGKWMGQQAKKLGANPEEQEMVNVFGPTLAALLLTRGGGLAGLGTAGAGLGGIATKNPMAALVLTGVGMIATESVGAFYIPHKLAGKAGLVDPNESYLKWLTRQAKGAKGLAGSTYGWVDDHGLMGIVSPPLQAAKGVAGIWGWLQSGPSPTMANQVAQDKAQGTYTKGGKKAPGIWAAPENLADEWRRMMQPIEEAQKRATARANAGLGPDGKPADPFAGLKRYGAHLEQRSPHAQWLDTHGTPYLNEKLAQGLNYVETFRMAVSHRDGTPDANSEEYARETAYNTGVIADGMKGMAAAMSDFGAKVVGEAMAATAREQVLVRLRG